ncbi:MAG: galactose oxidase [Vicinamibacterales bacterium]
MINPRDLGATLLTIVGVGVVLVGMEAGLRWEQLPSMPDREGFAGACAGVSGGALLVAGGANFPDKKPWEGGTKVWHETVFALDRPDGRWTVVGKLPRPHGYGVAVTHRDGVICVGGSDANGHYADSVRLDLRDGRLVTTNLPSLPLPVANACGAIVSNTLYVAGGQERPDSTVTLKRVFALDLEARVPRWREVEAWPGPGRMLAVAVAFEGAFWLIGGADLTVVSDGAVERRYLRDAYRYDPRRGWERIADVPHAVVAAPSPGPALESGPIVLGGDDGTQGGVAPDEHRGFSKRVLLHDRKSGTWRQIGELPAPRVTVPLVRWDQRWVIPSGEARPGVRSPDVWSALPYAK